MSAAWLCDRCGVPVGALCNPLTGDSRRALCYDCAVREEREPAWRRYSRAAVSEAIRYAWAIGARDATESLLGTLPPDAMVLYLARSHDQQLEVDGTIQIILDVVDGYRKPDGPRVRPEVN